MTVAFSEEQLAIQEAARRFSADRLAPDFQRLDVEGQLNREAIEEMGSLGLVAPSLPEDLGGLGAGSVTAGIVMEAVSEADSSVAYVPLTAALCGGIVAEFGSAALAEQVVPPVAQGKRLMALGLTEPRGGSDAANLDPERPKDRRRLSAQRRKDFDFHGGTGRRYRACSPAPVNLIPAHVASVPSTSTYIARAFRALASMTWARVQSAVAAFTSTMYSFPTSTCSATKTRDFDRSCKASTTVVHSSAFSVWRRRCVAQRNLGFHTRAKSFWS